MSSTAEKLANSPIERWVQAVELVDPESLNDLGQNSGELKFYDTSELFEAVDRISLAKRSKPSYQWEAPSKQEQWWRIWFQESNLTIQIDLYSADGRRLQNSYEIDLERCTTALEILDWLYHTTLGKRWSCPEMLWALMEILDEISQRCFGESLSRVLQEKSELTWPKPADAA